MIDENEASLRSRTSGSAAPYDAQSRMHERRIVGQRCLEVGDDRQRLVLDDDGVDRALGDLGGGRGDGGNDLALEANDVAREQRAVLHERTEADIGHVVGGEHCA